MTVTVAAAAAAAAATVTKTLRFLFDGTHEAMKDGTIKINEFMIACSFGYEHVLYFKLHI